MTQDEDRHGAACEDEQSDQGRHHGTHPRLSSTAPRARGRRAVRRLVDVSVSQVVVGAGAPGAATATEIQVALGKGLRVLKLLPLSPWAGSMIDALAAPFPMVGFMPAGGIGASPPAAYMAGRG